MSCYSSTEASIMASNSPSESIALDVANIESGPIAMNDASRSLTIVHFANTFAMSDLFPIVLMPYSFRKDSRVIGSGGSLMFAMTISIIWSVAP